MPHRRRSEEAVGRGGRRAWILASALLIVSCHHFPLKEPPRRADPLLPEIAAQLRPGSPGRGLTLSLIDESSLRRHHKIEFRRDAYRDLGEPEGEVVVHGEYYEVLGPPQERRPLVQVSPILGGALDGYLTSRIFAGWALDQGLSSFFLYQEDVLMAPERQGADFERLLVRMTRENRQALDLFVARAEVDATRLGSFGVSMGAIKNVLLVAAEPRLKANVLCLAGGDFARIVRLSREGMVLDYVRGREALEGLDRDAISDDLASSIQLDPIRVARYVDPARVLMFLGSLDDKVPYATGLALHRALGEPELYVYPIGHYTGLVIAPRVGRQGFRWMRAVFEKDHGNATVGKPVHR